MEALLAIKLFHSLFLFKEHNHAVDDLLFMGFEILPQHASVLADPDGLLGCFSIPAVLLHLLIVHVSVDDILPDDVVGAFRADDPGFQVDRRIGVLEEILS